MSFHEETINKIVNRLTKSKKYQYVLKNIPYSISEMDVVAFREVKKKDYLLVFEVKPRDIYKYRKKAYKQLSNHEKTFGDTVDKFYKFYVIPGERDGYKIKRIK